MDGLFAQEVVAVSQAMQIKHLSKAKCRHLFSGCWAVPSLNQRSQGQTKSLPNSLNKSAFNRCSLSAPCPLIPNHLKAALVSLTQTGFYISSYALPSPHPFSPSQEQPHLDVINNCIDGCENISLLVCWSSFHSLRGSSWTSMSVAHTKLTSGCKHIWTCGKRLISEKYGNW